MFNILHSYKEENPLKIFWCGQSNSVFSLDHMGRFRKRYLEAKLAQGCALRLGFQSRLKDLGHENSTSVTESTLMLCCLPAMNNLAE